LLKVLKYTFVT